MTTDAAENTRDGRDMTLRFSGVSKRFARPGGAEKLALDDVSFEVSPGELVGVFGPSAAGKTTLLRIAAGMLPADAGWVSYKGQRLDRMSVAERKRFRRQEIACVWSFQESQERLTVLDHVALPLLVDGRDRRVALSRAAEALLACEAEQCQEMEMRDLSDGERQRVAFARALVSEPRLVLADAPAANLSLPERETIMHLLSLLAREAKVAVLATSSDAESFVRADQLLYLRGGTLLTTEPSGSQGQLYSFPPVLSRRTAADA
jgi:putative ABC transport system ATP-binding protein